MESSQKIKERAIVFIDGNNLHRGLMGCYEIERLDLEPFCQHIVQERDLRNIYYADANFLQSINEETYARQQSYFNCIRKIKNLIFRKGHYSKYHRPVVEKKSDVFLATDMVDLCHRDEFDIAYLVSGDADLIPAIDIVRREGKQVVNVYFNFAKRNSRVLLPHCGGLFVDITKSLAEKYKWEYKKKP